MTTETDRSILRNGGLTSMAGGLVFIFVFAWVIILAGPDAEGTAGPIIEFPAIQAVRTVENGLYLTALALWIPAHLALYRALCGRSPGAAASGGALAVVGLGVLAAGAIPHIATSRLADLYHAPGATAADQATLVVAWQTVQGVFDALLVTGMLLVAAGMVVTGSAMPADPAFGKGIATVSVALGVAALAAGIFVLVEPTSKVAALGIFAIIAFHLILGWRIYRISRRRSA